MKEKLIKLLNSHTAYIMDIQRQRLCKITKANQKRFIEALVSFGLTKDEAVEVENISE